MKTNIKDITFGPEHVGMKATDIFGNKGRIVEFKESDHCPVKFKHNDDYQPVFSFRTDGTFGEIKHRCLFLGYDVELIVVEQDLSGEKFICPVCNFQHEPIGTHEGFILHTTGKAIHPNCPFSDALYLDKHTALKAYKTVCELGNKESKDLEFYKRKYLDTSDLCNELQIALDKEINKPIKNPNSLDELLKKIENKTIRKSFLDIFELVQSFEKIPQGGTAGE